MTMLSAEMFSTTPPPPAPGFEANFPGSVPLNTQFEILDVTNTARRFASDHHAAVSVKHRAVGDHDVFCTAADLDACPRSSRT